ncbi:MAG: DUF4923 family protein [Ferruginibacter sp.]
MKFYSIILICCSILILSSCENKYKKLISKKWDCVKIENLASVDENLFNAQDSAAALKIKDALNSLVWTFNSDNTYSCSIGIGSTVKGIYQISSNENLLTLTLVSENNINIYLINNLTETELTLTSRGTQLPLIMHFRPH